eukprot:TRINITY_DN22641_c0_g1_i4.p1 TRINITY_DN22641_c0_g1~~TRINITY_DN22641_c0_g1_i4.p1  ORF type:complete len:118 (-),score=2.35 TRINITY_DN22641_c0_g1_i4:65-418(-)
MLFLEAITALLNVGVLAGSCLVKLPQVYCIAKARSVRGLSEISFAIQAIGYSIGCCYGILMGYPFVAWGENFIITVQACGIVLMFWIFDPQVNSFRRCTSTAIWLGFKTSWDTTRSE